MLTRFDKREKKQKNILAVFQESTAPYVEVYVPISFFSHGGWYGVDFPLPKGKLTNFAANFDFSALAHSISKKSSEWVLEVGLTKNEVARLESRSTHVDLCCIVKIQIKKDNLMYRELDKSYDTQTYNIYDKTRYYMIKQGSTINVENIISARAMRYESIKTLVDNKIKKKRNEYGGSFYQGTYPEQFWPKGLTVVNPLYVNQSQLKHIDEFENPHHFFKQIPSSNNSNNNNNTQNVFSEQLDTF